MKQKFRLKRVFAEVSFGTTTPAARWRPRCESRLWEPATLGLLQAHASPKSGMSLPAVTISAMAEVYAPFEDAPVVITTNKTAEMIKYTSNAVLATIISFSNEIANLSSTLGGIDAVEVMNGVLLSRYFTMPTAGKERTTAPIGSFLRAGCGFGGSCLPKDVKALVSQGRSVGESMT